MDAGQLETAVGLFQRSIEANPHFKSLELLSRVPKVFAALVKHLQKRKALTACKNL